MAWRTSEPKVQGILGDNWDGSTSVRPFIETANVLTDEVSTCAAARDITLSSALLERIECFLSAHFYAHADPLFSEKKTERASGVFQVGKAEEGGYKSTQYGKSAISLDISGCLAMFNKGQQPTIAWLGKPPSEQTDYVDRD